MKQKSILVSIIVVLIVGGGFYYWNSTKEKSQNLVEGSKQKEDQEKSQAVTNQNNTEGTTVEGYQGKVLAGTKSPFIIFNKADYDKAVSSKKLIVLNFFANWCPICKAEAPEIQSGFDSLNNDQVIGFRVNFNDSDTDKDERALAVQYLVTLQHTKIFIKDGKVLYRTLDSLTKDTLISEVNKLLTQ